MSKAELEAFRAAVKRQDPAKKTPAECLAVLRSEGIVDRNGKLTKPYQSAKKK